MYASVYMFRCVCMCVCIHECTYSYGCIIRGRFSLVGHVKFAVERLEFVVASAHLLIETLVVLTALLVAV